MSETPKGWRPIKETELSGLEQWHYFTGMVAGYAIATSRELWATTDGRTFSIDDPTRGRRSRNLVRDNFRTARDVAAAAIGLFDAIDQWPEAAPLGPCPDGWWEGEP